MILGSFGFHLCVSRRSLQLTLDAAARRCAASRAGGAGAGLEAPLARNLLCMQRLQTNDVVH